LRRLGLGAVHHPHHHGAGGMDIQRQLEVLVWRLGNGLACDLRSARPSLKALSLNTHMLVDVAVWLRVRQHSAIYQSQFIPIRFILRDQLMKDDPPLAASHTFKLSGMLGPEVSVDNGTCALEHSV
jgi:hypothetical protein